MGRFSKLTAAALTASVAQAFAPTIRKPAPLPTILNVLGDATSVSTGNDDSFRKSLVGLGSFDIFDLLLQRSLQTQISYYKGTRNSLKADWLNGFAGHSHLDDGARWHSIVGMRVHCGEYLRDLLAEPSHLFTVQYGGEGKLGLDSASAATPLKDAGDVLGPHPDLMPWTAAAASRRRNPYLPKPKPMEFKEEVVPREVAAQLMEVCRLVAAEFQEDLALQASVDNAEFRAERAEKARTRAREARDKKRKLADVEETFDATLLESIPPFEAAERGRTGDSTPLRRLNYELLQRCATVLALKQVQEELAGLHVGASKGKKKRTGGPSNGADADAASLRWFDRFLADGGWWNELAAVTTSLTRTNDGTDVALDSVSDRLLRALDLGTPSFVPLGPLSKTPSSSDREKVLIDPPAMADCIRAKREQVAMALASQLSHCDEVLEAVVRESEVRARLERAVL